MSADDRQHVRLPIALQVEYRTTGAFLVAYSVNLSSGGIFLEAEEPLPIGSRLRLHFAVPGCDELEVEGEVAWVRHETSPGVPRGMGIRFVEPLEDRYGSLIDELALRFRGLKVVVMAQSPAARSVLVRRLRSLISTASVAEIADSSEAEQAFGGDADLGLIDLDDARAEGIVTLRLAKVGAERPVPVIATARDEASRARAREYGADEVLPNPPDISELHAAILRALGRPSRVA